MPANRPALSTSAIATLSLLLFAGLGLVGILNHVLWRDEMQGWLVAWESQTWVELWRNNAPSGHPILWSAVVFLAKDWTGTILSMKLLQWGLGLSALMVFWRWSPFQTLHKVLFTFGFFPFFEYFLIARQYILVELLTFILCASYPLRRKTYIPAALCIGLLANSHAFAWAIAFGFGLSLALEWLWDPEQRRAYLRGKLWLADGILSLSLVAGLVGFAAFSLLQSKDRAGIDPGIDWHLGLQVFGRVMAGYTFLIPNSQSWFDLWAVGIATLGLLVLVGQFLRRSRTALIFFCSSTASLLAFNYVVFFGITPRHQGYYYLILIAALWLALASEPTAGDRPPVSHPTRANWFYPRIFVVILLIHFGMGLYRFSVDLTLPLSAGRDTAAYIQQQGWSDARIVGSPDQMMSPIAGYLERSLYYPALRGDGTYTRWAERVPVERDEVLRQVEQLLRAPDGPERLLLILNDDLAWKDLNPGESVVIGPLMAIADARFKRAWHVRERYYLYWVALAP